MNIFFYIFIHFPPIHYLSKQNLNRLIYINILNKTDQNVFLATCICPQKDNKCFLNKVQYFHQVQSNISNIATSCIRKCNVEHTKFIILEWTVLQNSKLLHCLINILPNIFNPHGEIKKKVHVKMVHY